VLPLSPNGYRIIDASAGKLEVIQIPHMQNLKMLTRIIEFKQDMIDGASLWSHAKCLAINILANNF
jgi:hypothetical protein